MERLREHQHTLPAGGRILVVDDDCELTFILRAHLANAGLEVAVCHDGEEAIASARSNPPDVVVLDVQMPGISGLDVTRRLRDEPVTRNIPVILLTARGGQGDMLQGLGAGAQDYVTKPFNVAELTARVQSMLQLSHAKREIDQLNDLLVNEVRRKTERLELLCNYARDLNHAYELDEIYDLMIDVAQRSTGSRRVSLMMYDPADGQLRCKRSVGIDPELADKICVGPNTGIAGQVFWTGTAMAAHAVERPQSSKRNYASDAFFSTPIATPSATGGEKRLGVLNATDKTDAAPFTPDEIECLRSIADSAAIALHNVEQRSGMIKATRALLLTVGRLSEYRDEETGLHLERVAEYAHILGRRLAAQSKFCGVVTSQFVVDLHQAAPLHDVGKVGIPDEILNKPGKLTDEEYQIMKTHTSIGRHTLMRAIEETGPVPLLQMCVDIAYSHHEHYDGTGYPQGIAGEEIPLAARIIALVDAYDAITSQRCYKRALPHAKAVEIIAADAGGHFDPDIVAAFLEVTEEFDRIRGAKADQIEYKAELARA